MEELAFRVITLNNMLKHADFKYKINYDTLRARILSTGPLKFIGRKTKQNYCFRVVNDKIEYTLGDNDPIILEREL